MNDYYSPPDPVRPRILLVDDENAILKLLYQLLESEGYEVLAAASGHEAVAIFTRSIRPIALLVTDYDMPEMTGLELARECSRLCSGLSVLYVSGTHPDEELQGDLKAGKRAFIAKPFHRDDLLRKARELLAA